MCGDVLRKFTDAHSTHYIFTLHHLQVCSCSLLTKIFPRPIWGLPKKENLFLCFIEVKLLIEILIMLLLLCHGAFYHIHEEQILWGTVRDYGIGLIASQQYSATLNRADPRPARTVLVSMRNGLYGPGLGLIAFPFNFTCNWSECVNEQRRLVC